MIIGIYWKLNILSSWLSDMQELIFFKLYNDGMKDRDFLCDGLF